MGECVNLCPRADKPQYIVATLTGGDRPLPCNRCFGSDGKMRGDVIAAHGKFFARACGQAGSDTGPLLENADFMGQRTDENRT